MKTAREMFEELGYELSVNENCLIEYRKKNDKWWTACITFSKYQKYYISFLDNDKKQAPLLLLANEHLAIHQQMKELGWIK